MAAELGRFLSDQLANLPADHPNRTFPESVEQTTSGYIHRNTLSQEGGRFAKFTEAARRLLENAQDIAEGFNHRNVDTIHLAGACIKEVGVATFLRQAGVKVNKVLDLVASGLSEYNPSIESEGLTPKAKTAVEHCVGEARRVNATRIEAMHLFTGLVETDEEVGKFFETPKLTLEQLHKQAAAFNDRKNSIARMIQATILASICKVK